jgi:hypothetical protein
MTNGADSYSHVTKINQRDDNTIEVHVQTDNFTPGQAVEVSGYLTQGSGAYAAFHVTKHVPLDPAEPVLHVELPAMDLNAGEDVTVVTRVAEVWPTVLGQEMSAEYIGKGLKAVWTAQYPSGKGSGDTASPSAGNGGGGATTSLQS